MTNRVFIDSNIIANWIIISEAIKLTKETKDKIELNDFHKKIQNSYLLLEKIKENKYENESVQFFTSQFSLCEVYNVIGTEFKARKLFEKNIPFRYWTSMIKKIKLKNEQFPEINKSLDGFANTFLNPNNLKMNEVDTYKKDNVGRLLWIYNCNTHDGVLIAQAINKKCNYFITEDEELIKNMKNNHLGIKVYHCDTFIREKL